MYFSYGPDDGIAFHETLDQAKDRAEKIKEQIEFDAADSDWRWHDSGEDVCYGKVCGKLTYNDRDLDEEEKSEHPEWSFIRTVSLDEIP